MAARPHGLSAASPFSGSHRPSDPLIRWLQRVLSSSTRAPVGAVPGAPRRTGAPPEEPLDTSICDRCLYLRVSSEKQRHGFSLEFQRSALLAVFPTTPDRIFLDIAPGSEFDRPGLLAALTLKPRELIVYRLDRLSRSALLTHLIIYALSTWSGVLISASEDLVTPPSGWLLRGVIASVAEYEQLVISARTSEGIRKKRGWDANLKDRVKRLRRSGLSLRSIRDALRLEGTRVSHQTLATWCKTP